MDNATLALESAKLLEIISVNIGAMRRVLRRPFGMHAGYLPGYPASHGCIRMPKDKAALFFKNVIVGTSVRILPN